MDPISALGLAATVIQFVSFASSILTSTASAGSTMANASTDLLNLEDTGSKLRRLGISLTDAINVACRALDGSVSDSAGHRRPEWDFKAYPTDFEFEDTASLNPLSTLRDSYSSLRLLLSSSEADCNQLIDIVRKLIAKRRPGSKWSSFRVALGTVWKKEEISKIETGLSKTQCLVTLELCKISNIYHDIHYRSLTAFRIESQMLGIQQNSLLASVESMLDKLCKKQKEIRATAFSSLPAHVATLEDVMPQLNISERKIRKEISILRSLEFEGRTVRHDAIPPAHRETFRWVFEPDTRTKAAPGQAAKALGSNGLLDWLRHGDGTFWVSGKAGSGKSTLMKYLADHTATREALLDWSKSLPVVVASHYFWSPGTEMQRSHQGLLQTLLYDVLRHCPELIETTCNVRWTSGDLGKQEPWSAAELRSAIQVLSTQTKFTYRFCFFIDGLDEYEGDHIEFCEDLVTLLASPHIKLCLSSRPWNVFEDAFGGSEMQKIYVHELTMPDILRYASDRLRTHPRWKVIAAQSTRSQALIKGVAEKSQGVFLWVFIVTRLLREGLTEGDSFSDLLRRLDSFPAELEPFFKQMLDSVPSFYRQKMAESLQIALTAKNPLDAILYSFHDEDDEDDDASDAKTDAEISERDSTVLFNVWGSELPAQSMQIRREEITRRLNGRCRGLLEQNFLGQIEFLHRTVADFLKTRQMSNLLRGEMRKEFSANFAIFRAYVIWIKTIGIRATDFWLDSGDFARSLRTALEYAEDADSEEVVEKRTLDTILDDLERFLEYQVLAIPPVMLNDSAYKSGNINVLFREQVLAVPLVGYLSRKFSTKGRALAFLSAFEEPAVCAILQHPTSRPSSWPVRTADKLALLFDNGFDANRPILGTRVTPWTWFGREVILISNQKMIYMGPRFLNSLESNIFQAFLDHGADSNAKLYPNIPIFGAFLVISFDVPSEQQTQQAYLDVLDSFVQHGARFEFCNDSEKVKTISGEGRSAITQHLYNSPTAFFDRLEAERDKTHDRVDFFTEVVRRVLPLANDDRWPLRAYEAIVSRLHSAQQKGQHRQDTQNF